MNGVTANQVLAARILWRGGMSRGQIQEVLNLLPAVVAALTNFGYGLSLAEAARRATEVQPLMTREEIKRTMQEV